MGRRGSLCTRGDRRPHRLLQLMEWAPPPEGVAMCQDRCPAVLDYLREEATDQTTSFFLRQTPSFQASPGAC